jgi:hypothetical protein
MKTMLTIWEPEMDNRQDMSIGWHNGVQMGPWLTAIENIKQTIVAVSWQYLLKQQIWANADQDSIFSLELVSF